MSTTIKQLHIGDAFRFPGETDVFYRGRFRRGSGMFRYHLADCWELEHLAEGDAIVFVVSKRRRLNVYRKNIGQ